MSSDLIETDPIDAPNEATALRDLVNSAGWAILRRAIDAQWGPRAYGLKMRTLLAQIHGEKREAEIARRADALEATCNAVDEVIAWPVQRLRQIETRHDSRPFAEHRRTAP